MKNTVDMLFRYLPIRVSRAIHLLPNEILDTVNEIRLRRNAPISLTAGNRNIIFDESGRVCGINCAVRITGGEFDECVSRLTGGSLYTCDDYVAQGFIPLPEGGRAGVCGRANPLGGFAELTSVNLRLHRFLPDIASGLVARYRADGIKSTLVCSPPAMGKTTFLRSAAYLLASGKGIPPLRVCIADERNEISVGISSCGLLDAVSSLPKADAVRLLTRTMAPEIIICDEVGANEVEPLAESLNAGVSVIASAHCTTPRDLLKRGRMKALLDPELFPLCVVLGYDGGYTYSITETEALL